MATATSTSAATSRSERRAPRGLWLAAGALAAWPAVAQEVSGSAAPVAAPLAPASSGITPGSADSLPGIPSSPERPDVRVGGFVAAPFATGGQRPAGPSGATRAYEIVPSLSGSFFATDNVNATGGNRRSELALTLTPGLSLRADSAALRGGFSFAPSLVYYVNGTQPNRVATNFVGTGTAEIIPGRFFVDVRGLAFLQPITPGATIDTTLGNTRSPALQQNFVAAISPYYIQRFGTLASGIVGYQLQYSTVQGTSLFVAPDGTVVRNNPGGSIGQTAYAGLRTGEDFGRLTMEARINANFFSGGGAVNNNSQNILAGLDARYAITRTVFLLGEIGWQDIRFGGVPGFSYDGVIWGGGVRVDPSENSTLIAVLRSRAGFTSPLIDARVNIGPRTVLFGRYAEDVGNAVSQGAALLNSIALDPAGNPVSSTTGAPLPQVGGTGFLGTTGGVSRNRTGVASATRFFQRSSLSLQYVYSQRIPLSASAGQIPFAQVNNTVSVTASRELTPVTTGFATAGYTWTRSTFLNLPSESVIASLGVRTQLTERLAANLSYFFTHRTQGSVNAFGSVLTSDSTQNSVIGSLSMRF